MDKDISDVFLETTKLIGTLTDDEKSRVLKTVTVFYGLEETIVK